MSEKKDCFFCEGKGFYMAFREFRGFVRIECTEHISAAELDRTTPDA